MLTRQDRVVWRSALLLEVTLLYRHTSARWYQERSFFFGEVASVKHVTTVYRKYLAVQTSLRSNFFWVYNSIIVQHLRRTIEHSHGAWIDIRYLFDRSIIFSCSWKKMSVKIVLPKCSVKNYRNALRKSSFCTVASNDDYSEAFFFFSRVAVSCIETHWKQWLANHC